MVRHSVVEPQAAEPAVGEVEMDFVAQPAFGANAVAVADDQHPDHQFQIDRRTPGGTVVIFQVRTQILQVEATVNRPQQVIGRNMILKIEAVEQSILITLLLPHHLGYPIASMHMAYYTMGVFQQHRLTSATHSQADPIEPQKRKPAFRRVFVALLRLPITPARDFPRHRDARSSPARQRPKPLCRGCRDGRRSACVLRCRRRTGRPGWCRCWPRR